MSVTFFAPQPTIGYRNECGCGEAVSDLIADYDEASALLRNGEGPMCGDEFCADMSRGYTVAAQLDDNAPTVNMANPNARDVLVALGYDLEDLSGSRPGSVLLDDVNRALALTDADPGRPTVTEGNVVLCGRVPLYVQSRLDDIRAVALFAAERGYEVCWG